MKVEKRLSSKEITAIIKVASAYKVAMLKFGDLSICFNETREVQIGNRLKKFTDTEISEIQKHIEEESLEVDEVRLKEDQVIQTIIEDPVLGEQLLIDEQLEEVFGGSNDDDGSDE